MQHILTGKTGEKNGCNFLKSLGFKILSTNYRCNVGEVDIIADDNNYLVFVEVKTKEKNDSIPPFFAVNKRKQLKIIKASLFYIKEHGVKNKDIRYDVLSIIGDKIEHIKNAFSTDGYTY